MRYAVVIEKVGDNYSAYVPDLPGCVATGATREEAEQEKQNSSRHQQILLLYTRRSPLGPIPRPAARTASVILQSEAMRGMRQLSG